MFTRRTFLKVGCGAVAGALLASQRPLRSFARQHAGAEASISANAAVIMMAAPSINDAYYRQFFTDLLAFYGRLVAVAHPNDVPLVMVDSATFARAAAVIPAENLIIGNIPDVWMRDFSPIRTKSGNFDFTYAPQYLASSDTAYIEQRFNAWFSRIGLTKKRVPLILDGGNYLYNGVDSAVVTTRILADNRGYTRTQIVNTFKRSLGLTRLAIIPEEPGDITGHADGMVTWLAPNKLGVVRFPEPLRSRVRTALSAALPNVQQVEIPYVPHDDVWQDWSTAKGVYVNALITANAIYVPMFGLAADAEALAIYRQHATKPIIPVPVGPEVSMGGSVRCLTWEVDSVDAQTLLGYYDGYDVYTAATTPTVAEEAEMLPTDEVVAIDLSAEEITVDEIDNATDRKLFSAYLPLVSQ